MVVSALGSSILWTFFRESYSISFNTLWPFDPQVVKL